MVKHYARERVFTAGDVARVNIYPVRKVARSRGAKRLPSRACQEALNKRNSKKRFQDIVHLTFTKETGGLRLSLDYNGFIAREGRNPTEAEWKACVTRYFRLLRELYRANGGELFYALMTHVGRRAGKVHHHAIVSLPPRGVTREQVEELWREGYGNTASLKFINGSVGGLTSYFFDNSVDSKWSCSKNCKRPSERPYADGSPASVDYVDGHVTMADAKYIDSNPEDIGFIERLFPGFAVSHVRVTPEYTINEGGGVVVTIPAFGGPFLEIELYRIEGKAFGKRRKNRKEREYGEQDGDY